MWGRFSPEKLVHGKGPATNGSHPGRRNLHEPPGSEPPGGVTAGGHHGGTCTEESRSLGRCPVPVLGSAPLRLTRRPSHWELERDARGQGFQNRRLTGTLVRDRLTVDRRTRTSTRCSVQSPTKCSSPNRAPATDQPTVDNVARSLKGYRPEP